MPSHFIQDLGLVNLENKLNLQFEVVTVVMVVLGEAFVFGERKIKPNSLYISWVSRRDEDEQGMKKLIDGEEEDAVGYQAGYVVLDMESNY